MRALLASTLALAAGPAIADPPVSSYIFPAGGQRGTTVACRAAGLNLSSECGFGVLGGGIDAPARVRAMPTLVLAGPYHHNPIAQQAWDYPKDMDAAVTIERGAAPGARWWFFSTAEGATQPRAFVVGDLPEALEEEERPASAGPQHVELPVTLNGRIYPRADLDEYAFAAKAGDVVTCELLSQRLGYKLDARLEARTEDGRTLAENDDAGSRDPLLGFTAPADGTYVVRVHDIAFEGDQDYIYRLTLRAGPFVTHTFPAGGRRGAEAKVQLLGIGLGSGGFIERKVTLPADPAELFDWNALGASLPGGCHVRSPFLLGDDPEAVEVEPNDDGPHAQRVEVPVAINGRIAAPGDADEYVLSARKGQPIELELFGRRLGSPITAVWTVRDAEGKEAVRREGDGRMEITPSADGDCRVRVRELHRETHGGPEYVYRLAVRPAAPGFRLALDRDAAAVLPGQAAKVKLGVTRSGGFQGEVRLEAKDLPPGVTMDPNVVPAGKDSVDLSFQAAKDAPAGVTRRGIVEGAAMLEGTRVVRTAEAPLPAGAAEGDARIGSLAVTVTDGPLFAITTEEVYGAAHRGATYVQRFRVERKAGFEGEVVLCLADRQTRYLQGLTGPMVVLKPGETEVEYPVFLPEGMDLNRTARVLLMGTARITDAAGGVRFVTHTTQKQLIARVESALLTLASDMSFCEAKRGGVLNVPLRVGRAQGLVGPVTVEARPAHGMKGLTAAPASVGEAQEAVTLAIQVAGDAEVAADDRVTFRATAMHGGFPVVAERSIEVEIAR